MKDGSKRASLTLILLTILLIIILAVLSTKPLNDSNEIDENETIIIPGEGLSSVRLADSIVTARDKFGEPDEEVIHGDLIWTSYRESKGIDLLSSRTTGRIIEIRFNPGFNGSLENGIRIGSDMEKVLKIHDGPEGVVDINITDYDQDYAEKDNVLYRRMDEDGEVVSYKFHVDEMGLLYWFGPFEQVTQIVVY